MKQGAACSASPSPVGHVGTPASCCRLCPLAASRCQDRLLSARSLQSPPCPGLLEPGTTDVPGLRAPLCRGEQLCFTSEDQHGIIHTLPRCQGTPHSCQQQTLSFVCRGAGINQSYFSPALGLGRRGLAAPCVGTCWPCACPSVSAFSATKLVPGSLSSLSCTGQGRVGLGGSGGPSG